MEINYKEVLGMLSVIIGLTGSTLYIISVLKGKTKPHLYSHGIWAILMIIAFYGQYSDKGGAGSWAIGFGAFTSFIIMCLSFKYGTKNITLVDKGVLYCILCGIIIYLYSKNLEFSIFLVIVLDALGYIPTLRKTRIEPYSEDLSVWSITIPPLILAMFALENYTFLTYGYLLTLVCMNIITIGVILYFRKYQVQKKNITL